MNAFEHAAREWLRGCNCAPPASPEDCEPCTRAMLELFKKMGGLTEEAEEVPTPDPAPDPAPDPVALHNARKLS